MRGLGLLYRLSVAFFAALLAFIGFLLLAGARGWVSNTGAGLLGTFGLLGFIALGLPLCILLAPRVQQKQPTWLFASAYLGLALVGAVGAWVLLGYLTYLAHLKLEQGN